MGKDLLFDVLKHKKTSRPAWVPFAGIHSGKLCGHTAYELLTNKDKLLQSLLEVNKIYTPDGQPVLFDLQVEAEILGCDLKWSDDTPPTVSTHPLSETMEIPCMCKMPTKEMGRLPMILDVMREMKKAVGDSTALYGLVCGPFTLASHLRGTDIFMDMFDEDEYVKELIAFCNAFVIEVTKFYIEAGMDIIAVVDPLVSQISSNHFEEFLTKPFTEFFDYVRKAGRFSSFFVCGDATRNLDVMCQTGPDAISIDENIKMDVAKKITDKYNITIGGNIPLTTVMLHGSQNSNMKYVVEMLDSLEDKNNLIVSPGCDMPYDVPIENTVGVCQAVIEFDKVKEMVKDFEGEDFSQYEIVIPDYANLKKPFMEVFTLDSSSCAACTYMMGIANDAKAIYGDEIDLIEYKFTEKINIARCIKMGVAQLPSIYINGELRFSSIIPSIEELKKAIDSAKK